MAGVGNGSVVGKTTYTQATLEGIEHGPAPHKIGSAVRAVHRTIGTICTNELLYSPSLPIVKLVITDIILCVTDATTTIVLSEGTLAAGQTMFRASVKPASNQTTVLPINYTLPHPFATANTPLYFSQTGAATVDVNIHLYESE
jgi:hypothetical protein